MGSEEQKVLWCQCKSSCTPTQKDISMVRPRCDNNQRCLNTHAGPSPSTAPLGLVTGMRDTAVSWSRVTRVRVRCWDSVPFPTP